MRFFFLINFLMSTALATSHKFWYAAFIFIYLKVFFDFSSCSLLFHCSHSSLYYFYSLKFINICFMAYHVVCHGEWYRSLLTIRFYCKKNLLWVILFLIVFQIVVIMRGLPGSGKTHVAKLIRVSMEKPKSQLLLLAACLFTRQRLSIQNFPFDPFLLAHMVEAVPYKFWSA